MIVFFIYMLRAMLYGIIFFSFIGLFYGIGYLFGKAKPTKGYNPYGEEQEAGRADKGATD